MKRSVCLLCRGVMLKQLITLLHGNTEKAEIFV